jgi:hypothetical protein
MAEYTVKLSTDDREAARAAQVEVDALTEFEAAAVGLNELRQRGEPFTGATGVEILQGNVTETKPVPVRDITYWLRNKAAGQELVERDGLQPLLDYVKD